MTHFAWDSMFCRNDLADAYFLDMQFKEVIDQKTSDLLNCRVFEDYEFMRKYLSGEFLGFIFDFICIYKKKASFGQDMKKIKYSNSIGRYCYLDILLSNFDRLFNATFSKFKKIYAFLSLSSFILFLIKGKRMTIYQQIFNLEMVKSYSNDIGGCDSSYLDRQLSLNLLMVYN